MQAERVYTCGELLVRFSENKEIEAHCYRFDEPYTLAVDILVLLEGEILHRYFRHFEKDVHLIHYRHFIKKFLREPLYRQQYLVTGETPWEGILNLDSGQKKTS